MMELSIIVVNYNVKYFLQVCLESLHAASAGLNSEIIVVDNASSDGSIEMISNQFPSVKLIRNTKNCGFGRACNQALKIAEGRYILFVNPDTLVGESLLSDAIGVFQNDDKIGAVGVCLLDGNGQVLRESKRSIPTLWSAFTKFSGLSEVFRHSAFFNGYYAPELQYHDSGDIEVLPGAFMLIRKHVLDKLDGFDPRFFMYAEDIDLSYRITRAGYRIRYDGSLHVIHFKGESTQKSLTTYTNTFFHSMRLFIRKYKGELYAPPVAWLLQSIVRTIQSVEMIKRRSFIRKRKAIKPKFPGEVFVFTNQAALKDDLAGYMEVDHLVVVPDSGMGEAPFYLRYAPSYLSIHPDTALILDFRSLLFDEIVELWKKERKKPVYIADGLNSFFIGSHNREKQGEVHTFAACHTSKK